MADIENVHVPILPPELQPKSPTTREVDVIDVDYAFTSGELRGFTLWPERGDKLVDDSDIADVLLLHDEGGSETITIYRSALAWQSVRARKLTILIEKPVIQSPDAVARQDLLDSPRSESASYPAPEPSE